jgi:hypothetical protein|tara:strand:+ start:1654 stop:1890 length:237 start_codon:yes stop_codon:yes gene_type:complete
MDLIRKIVIGANPKDALAYYVGMRAGQGNVCAIKEDEAALYKYNVRRYHVFVEDDDSTYIWKTIENLPILIEYDCNFE